MDPPLSLLLPPGDSNLMLWLSEKSAKGPDWVVEGYPVGQFYGLGGIWAKFADLGRITENLGEDTPAREVCFPTRENEAGREGRERRGEKGGVAEQFTAGLNVCGLLLAQASEIMDHYSVDIV